MLLDWKRTPGRELKGVRRELGEVRRELERSEERAGKGWMGTRRIRKRVEQSEVVWNNEM